MKIARKTLQLADAFEVKHGGSFRLKDYDPADLRGIHSREKADRLLEQSIAMLREMQEKLYAQDQWSLLLVFQAMDAAGKDSAIKHVMSGVNPQGCQVYSFKHPSATELDHDFPLAHGAEPAGARQYRHLQSLVLRGGADRSCASRTSWSAEHLPLGACGKARSGSSALSRSCAITSGYLYPQRHPHPQVLPATCRREEQKRIGCLARLDEPEKNWKWNAADVRGAPALGGVHAGV
jgi:hypothetical protein